MNEDMSDLPQAETADPDGVQVALQAARTLWSRGDTAESLKWLRKAAESASDEGADMRSLQLAKAAAELRAKLFGSSEPPPRQGPLPGESGAHPIAQPRGESEPARSAQATAPSSPPNDASPSSWRGDSPPASRPITATQYPSHRPRQRIGLSSAYAQVPSWSAESERRASSAPPPLPRASTAEFEELDAVPDEEPVGDDPGSVWSSSSPPSWHGADGGDGYGSGNARASGGASRGTPPPLPRRRKALEETGGAYAEDDGAFGESSDAATVVLPPLDGGSLQEHGSSQDRSRAWGQNPHASSWDSEAASSWAVEMHAATWGVESRGNESGRHDPTGTASSGHDSSGHYSTGHDSSGHYSTGHDSSGHHSSGHHSSGHDSDFEPAPPSEPARAKLTARVHHQAVRVSFAPDDRVPGQFVVRPLREGEKAGTGERVALLVALEPGVPLV